MIDDIYANIDSKNVIIRIFIDLQKAFVL